MTDAPSQPTESTAPQSAAAETPLPDSETRQSFWKDVWNDSKKIMSHRVVYFAAMSIPAIYTMDAIAKGHGELMRGGARSLAVALPSLVVGAMGGMFSTLSFVSLLKLATRAGLNVPIITEKKPKTAATKDTGYAPPEGQGILVRLENVPMIYFASALTVASAWSTAAFISERLHNYFATPSSVLDSVKAEPSKPAIYASANGRTFRLEV